MNPSVLDPVRRPAAVSSLPFLEEHLNVNWLRPESALWDTVASSAMAPFRMEPPSLDLGSGNGIFSFITAGGAFSEEYDWYRNVDPTGFWENRDVYDCFRAGPPPEWITRRPRIQIDWALDHKENLLRQAAALDFYRQTKVANANHRLPFEEESFQTVFSNILYWLDSLEFSLKEVWRVLRPGGRALLSFPDRRFIDFCVSFRWGKQGSRMLKMLNRGRSENIRWTASASEFKATAERLRFKVVSRTDYISPLTLRVWDIGLRPLSPVLIRLMNQLGESDRVSVKREWVGILLPFLRELTDLDKGSRKPGGYHLVCLEKK